MRGTIRHAQRQEGFTLIEVIVVIAILGILAAILLPSVTGLLAQGDETALNADVESVQLAVAEFKLDRHDGPNGTFEWGTERAERLFPTEDGEVGDIELNESIEDPNRAGNPRVDKYAAGPTTNGTAVADDITDSLVWLGLVVNEPFDQSGAPQQTTGDASPQGGEEGEYLPDFPESAHADNTTLDPSGSATTGTYRFVVLHNGEVAAVYLSGGAYYAGFDGVYP